MCPEIEKSSFNDLNAHPVLVGKKKCGNMSKAPRQPTYDPNLVEVKAKVSNTGINISLLHSSDSFSEKA